MSTTATRTEPKTTTVEKPRLILTHGEKGGVGKTTVARIIADYLVSRDTSFRAFDAEGATGQLLRFHPEETDAVAVESALQESSPSHHPSGVLASSKARRAFRNAA